MVSLLMEAAGAAGGPLSLPPPAYGGTLETHTRRPDGLAPLETLAGTRAAGASPRAWRWDLPPDETTLSPEAPGEVEAPGEAAQDLYRQASSASFSAEAPLEAHVAIGDLEGGAGVSDSTGRTAERHWRRGGAAAALVGGHQPLSASEMAAAPAAEDEREAVRQQDINETRAKAQMLLQRIAESRGATGTGAAQSGSQGAGGALARAAVARVHVTIKQSENLLAEAPQIEVRLGAQSHITPATLPIRQRFHYWGAPFAFDLHDAAETQPMLEFEATDLASGSSLGCGHLPLDGLQPASETPDGAGEDVTVPLTDEASPAELHVNLRYEPVVPSTSTATAAQPARPATRVAAAPAPAPSAAAPAQEEGEEEGEWYVTAAECGVTQSVEIAGVTGPDLLGTIEAGEEVEL